MLLYRYQGISTRVQLLHASIEDLQLRVRVAESSSLDVDALQRPMDIRVATYKLKRAELQVLAVLLPFRNRL
jgi:hypothetical protein